MYKIGDVEFENRILNASGCWCTYSFQLEELFNSKLGGVVSKTFTKNEKIGNNTVNYYKYNDIHFNCKGLPNLGYNYYKQIISHKPFILSVAYINIDELKDILIDYENSINKSVLIEINLSCPNLESRIHGYHKKDVKMILDMINDLNLKNINIGLKLPPYFEIEFINKFSCILNNYNIKFITVSNSIPNGVILKDNNFVLSKIFGGMSGKINKYISLSNVISFRKVLKQDIKIIGCGGIDNINDICDYLKNGADFIQLGSCFYIENTNKLDIEKINSLIDEYKNTLEIF